jgi:hypothetical protein
LTVPESEPAAILHLEKEKEPRFFLCFPTRQVFLL